MRTYPATDGPFPFRPFYEPHEIESICTLELRAAGCLPGEPGPVRIDRFIEKRFGVVPEYEELPASVLGFSMFGEKGVEAIVVAKFLDEDGDDVSQRRIRTTLAHECGHVLLHGGLFSLADRAPTLFGDAADERPKVMCRDLPGVDADPRRRYDGRWWEFQANAAIGALLLPCTLVETALEPLLVRRGRLGARALDTGRVEEATRILSDIFDVNPAVARIRLGELFRSTDDPQESL